MAAFDQLRDKWEAITPRERRMVVVLGVSVILVLIIYVALEIRDGMAAIEAKNQKARRALAALTAYKASARTGDSPDVPKIPDQAVKLETYLYNAGSKANVTVPKVDNRTPVTKGKYTTHAVNVEVRDLTLTQVKDFLEAIETTSKVVQVTSMQLRRNFRDKEKLDLSIEVATWSNAAAGGDGGGGSGKGTAKAGG